MPDDIFFKISEDRRTKLLSEIEETIKYFEKKLTKAFFNKDKIRAKNQLASCLEVRNVYANL